jgi:hypothetical protein
MQSRSPPRESSSGSSRRSHHERTDSLALTPNASGGLIRDVRVRFMEPTWDDVLASSTSNAMSRVMLIR